MATPTSCSAATQFAKSMRDANSFPENIARTTKSAHALLAYNARIAKDEGAIFVRDKRGWAIFLWDLHDTDTEFQVHDKISTLEQLTGFMSTQTADPRCRFVFLQTASSRGPMCCNRAQLEYLLTYHQVMPSILDFCFRFRKTREMKPSTANFFRVEDFLGDHQQQYALSAQDRSGTRIQHAFSIMSYEDTSNSGDADPSWNLRQTTAYHSFDFEKGKSCWIVIKGNKDMRERLTTSSKTQGDRNLESMKTIEGSFDHTMKTHLQILEWSTENWNQYIEHLEASARKQVSNVKHVPVDEMARRMPDFRPLHSRSTSHSQQHVRSGIGTGTWTAGLPGRRRLTSLSARIVRRKTRQQSENTISAHHEETVVEGKDDEKLENIFTFDDLQSIHGLAENVAEASLVIDQNAKILATLRDRYSALAEREEFQPFVENISQFCQQVEVLGGDLESHRMRIAMLSQRLDKVGDLFKSILEYRNMRYGEHFAESAQRSSHSMEGYTVKMHDIAAKTEQETISMLVITVFTLIFLPGTFVSTLFSSDIMDFDGGKGTDSIGDWAIRWPALKLFIALCIPLMVISFPVWWITYKVSGKRHRAREVANNPEEGVPRRPFDLASLETPPLGRGKTGITI